MWQGTSVPVPILPQKIKIEEQFETAHYFKA
jgi:hypothetical protein